ncbi:MAG TPA: GNAT family N-acetyltransferase [Solirubrobacterales bacterium]|nr:GNAT family N-acetyltransferase [Solirubrobacterales bacterium]
MSSVSIRPVRTRRELKRFVKVPFRLHREHPQWVAPLIFDRMQFLDRRRNPYFEHAEAEYFLAERDGEPVGRITAQIDERWDEYQGGSDGMFGFFETIEDREVAAALLEAAEGWLRERGRERVLGPMDFTTNDELGILIDGFELRPMILQPWHPPFYRELLEGLGYGKAIDLLMWYLELGELKEGDQFTPEIHAAAEKALRDEGVEIRKFVKRNLAEEMRRFTEVYNEAWSDNWGFVPATDAEVEFHAKLLKQLLDEDWGFIAEKDGETVGVAFTLPDINQALAKVGGRLLPFGWLRFLMARRKIDRVRVFALGVKHAYRHSGVAAGLYLKHLESASPEGIPAGETGWILETNGPMNRAMEGMGGKVVKRYRVYEKPLGPTPPLQSAG